MHIFIQFCFLLSICLFHLILGNGNVQGFPKIPPTKGEPWPLPQNMHRENGHRLVQKENFSFKKDGRPCNILTKAFERYQTIIFPEGAQNKNENRAIDEQSLKELKVFVTGPCEKLPKVDMSEQYELNICTSDSPNSSFLYAQSVWGALRGLETFSQLLTRVNRKSDALVVNCTRIYDFPRFSYRGMMLDTSRHFLPVKTILENLELMAMNKLNVFHWHIVDDQSFPYQSDVYPDLSAKGAWSPKHIYTSEDIKLVVKYAAGLGIRVVPEFDTPGHVRSWGEGQKELLTKCYDKTSGQPNGQVGPIDPTKEKNYVFLTKLLTEVATRFPEHYLHLGGDEVPFECWKSNPIITDFMHENNVTTYQELEEFYIQKLIKIVEDLPTKNGYIVWQEVFDNGVKIAPDTVVHVWKNKGNEYLYSKEMAKVTKAGYRTILSSCWYLNYISYGVDWHKYYKCEPTRFEGTQDQKDLVLGGEICMWGEFVDATNLISTTWPRASAAAERLWSSIEKTVEPEAAAPRLEEQRCRLLNRGYQVKPFGPSFCEII